MPRYWIISPYDSANATVWDRAWKYDLSHGTIAIGWSAMGDISSKNPDEIKKLLAETYPKESKRGLTLSFNTIWRFFNEIKEGDVIVARKGTKRIAAIGTVNHTAYNSMEHGKERVGETKAEAYTNFIGVQWSEKPRDMYLNNMTFSMITMYEMPEEKYKEMISGSPETFPQAENVEFVLEKYLEEFIVTNFKKIFHGNLVLYKDAEGNVAEQYATDVGNIDILAKDPKTNSFVVIELKKSYETDKVVGQILRYMGWVQENLCEEGQGVKGIIICRGKDQKMDYALKMVKNIDVQTYEVDFQLKNT